MLIGYDINSGNDAYRMWDPDTKKIHNTCDIILLRRMFYQGKLTTGMVVDVTQFDDSYINEIEVGINM